MNRNLSGRLFSENMFLFEFTSNRIHQEQSEHGHRGARLEFEEPLKGCGRISIAGLGSFTVQRKHEYEDQVNRTITSFIEM